MRSPALRPTLLAAPLALALALTACSSDSDVADDTAADPVATDDSGVSDVSDGGDATTLDVTAADISFDQTSLSAPAGTITIQFDNQDQTSHNLHVMGDGVDAKTEVAEGPVTQTLEFDAAAGEYSYQCDVHPGAMSGTLTVG